MVSLQTKKTFFPSLIQSLLSLVLIIGVFGKILFFEDGLICCIQTSVGGRSATLQNYFGDVIGLGSSGVIANYGATFTSYGLAPGSAPDAASQSLTPQWRGRYLDETGFVSMGARYYEPHGGRFLSADPLGHDASLSLYDYCGGDPLNGLDPDGRCGKKALNAVPGQAAWQQSVASFNNGDYVGAGLNAMAMIGEQVLNVATLGMGSAASAGSRMFAGVAEEAFISAETGLEDTIFTTWNEFQVATRGQFASRAEAAAAWNNYKQGMAAEIEGAKIKSIIPYSGQIISTAWPCNEGFIGSITEAELKMGTVIDRYGLRSGTYAALQGTPFGNRGLPLNIFNKFTPEAYEVLQPFSVKAGLSAPGFGYPGLGIQYKLPLSVQELIDLGVLRPIAK